MVMVVQFKYLLTVPLYKFVEGQVTGLATSHPSQFKFLQHMVSYSFQEEEVVIYNGWIPE